MKLVHYNIRFDHEMNEEILIYKIIFYCLELSMSVLFVLFNAVWRTHKQKRGIVYGLIYFNIFVIMYYIVLHIFTHLVHYLPKKIHGFTNKTAAVNAFWDLSLKMFLLFIYLMVARREVRLVKLWTLFWVKISLSRRLTKYVGWTNKGIHIWQYICSLMVIFIGNEITLSILFLDF